MQSMQAYNAVSLLQSLGIYHQSSWAMAHSNEFCKPYFLQLQHLLSMERKLYNIFPPHHQVLDAWTQMYDIRDVKVGILGQNPYHNFGQANGLCFSVPQGIPLPRSLQNIYTEVARDITGFVPPGHGDLTGWAKQDQMQSIQANYAVYLLQSLGIDRSWAIALFMEVWKPYFHQLQDFVSKERQSSYTIFPPPHQVYTWTQMCDIRDVKVVILGQDPYHNVGQAHGLCFSVPQEIQPPPSLQNMYKELAKDIKGFEHPGHGNLTGWAKQGVLLLNAVLTVRAHTPNSHKDKGWEKFTDAVIDWLNKNQEKIVFMLWGSYAQKKGAIIYTKRHCVLKTSHPSPFSAHHGFSGCGHFSKANEYLMMCGKTPINWSSL